MQFFERSAEPPPKFFRGSVASGARHRLLQFFELDPVERAQTRFSDHALDLKDGTVFDGLGRLFRGKCAFCETRGETFPYRFRPSASATPEAKNSHLYYSWLANAWENIYPICHRCVPRQSEFFPVTGNRVRLPDIDDIQWYVDEDLGSWRGYPIAERQLLIDPCRNERFYDYFFISITGMLQKQGARGALTIEHFKLNREDLVEKRRIRLGEYRRLLLTPDTTERLVVVEGNFPIFDFSNLEFGGLWYLQCRMIVQHLSRALKKKVDVSRTKVGHSFRALSLHKGFDEYREILQSWIETGDFGRYPSIAITQPERVEPTSMSDEQLPVTPSVYPSLLSIELTHFKAIDYLKLQLTLPSADSVLSSEPMHSAMLILGENATGKSSILEATALALSDRKTRKALGLKASDLVLDSTQLGAKNQNGMLSAQIRLGFDEGPDTVLEINKAGWKPQTSFLRPPVFAYGAFRQYQKNSDKFKLGHSVFNLFNSNRLLPDPEPWLLALKDDDLNEVTRALRFIMTVEENIQVIEKSEDELRCFIVTVQGGVKVKTPLTQVSSGYRSVLAMVCDIMRRLMDRSTNPHYQSLENARAIVLIDEVEAHLHPRWKIQIMGALRMALPKVTFIATSHDPLCVRGMRNGEVIVVHRTTTTSDGEGGDTEQRALVEQLQHLPDISQLTIEQLLTSDFFNVASTDQPVMNLKMAKLADLLSASYRGELSDPEDQQLVARFKQEINDVLPVGTTRGQQVVQEAVARFLQARTTASSEQLKALDEAAKREILDLLEGF